MYKRQVQARAFDRPIVGSIVYKACIQLAITAGLPANLLKLITAALFLVILVAGSTKGRSKARA